MALTRIPTSLLFTTVSPSGDTSGVTDTKNLNALLQSNNIVSLIPGNQYYCSTLFWDHGKAIVEGNGAKINFTPLGTSNSNAAIVCATANYRDAINRGWTDTFFYGPGTGGNNIGIMFGTSSVGMYSSFVRMDGIGFLNWNTAMSWGNNSWLQDLGSVVIAFCPTGINFPSGLINSGENIRIRSLTLDTCTNGIVMAGGDLTINQVSFDYCTSTAITCTNGGAVRVNMAHLESSYDNDYWLKTSGGNSMISFNKLRLVVTGAKSTYAVGIANDGSNCNISVDNLNALTFDNWVTYAFNYLINGRGNCLAYDFFSANPGWPIFSNGANFLMDGGFERAGIVDWLNFGNAGTLSLSSAQAYAGSNSMALTPTNVGIATAITYIKINPSAILHAAFRYKQAGTTSTDHLYAVIDYYDNTGNILNEESYDIGVPTTSWQRQFCMLWQSSVSGASYASIKITKSASGGGNSDGNGAFYIDDAYVTGIGTSSSCGFTDYPPYRKTGIASNSLVSIAGGFVVSGIRIINTTANAVTGGVSLGTTSGATDVLASVAVAGNADVWVPSSSLAKTQFSTFLGNANNIWFNAVSAWNGASLNVLIYVTRSGGVY